jgi:hypothetical protein
MNWIRMAQDIDHLSQFLKLFILAAHGFLPGGSGNKIRHNKQLTYITRNSITIKRNTANKTTHTIQDTLHRMNTNNHRMNTNKHGLEISSIKI